MDNKSTLIQLIDYWLDTAEDSEILADRIIKQLGLTDIQEVEV